MFITLFITFYLFYLLHYYIMFIIMHYLHHQNFMLISKNMTFDTIDQTKIADVHSDHNMETYIPGIIWCTEYKTNFH
jgi:hypothetical protein